MTTSVRVRRPSGTVAAVLAMEGVVASLGVLGVLGLGLPLEAAPEGTLPALGWGVGGALLPLSLVPASLGARSGLVGRVAETGRWVVRHWFLSCSVPQLLLVALAAGVGEELFFRGLLQAGLEEVMGVTGALLVASALFGACHLVTPLYGLGAAVMGLLWGGLFLAAGGLVAPMIAHAGYDFGALLLATRHLRASEDLRGRASGAGRAVG